MTNFLGPVVRQQAWALGVVAPGAVLHFFLSGTSTPQAVFTPAGVSLGTTLTADANGRFAAFAFGPVAYRVRMDDTNGATIFGPEDNITTTLAALDAGLSLGGDLVFTANSNIRRSTSDAADTGSLSLVGGGAAGASRGGYVVVYGNENAGLPGSVQLLIGNIAGATLNVARSDGTTALSVDGATGLLNLPYGQIQFPATQNPSTSANILDDYEETTWTPVIGGTGGTSGQTYAANGQIGSAIKIGKLVVVQFYVELTAKGTVTGSVQIEGLPFTAQATTNLFSMGALEWNGLNTTWVNVALRLAQGATAAVVEGTAVAASGNVTALTTADLTNATRFIGTLCYRAQA